MGRLLTVAACILFLAGGLSAQVREGDIMWYPESEMEGIRATYVQGPYALSWQGEVFIGGHAGFFGPPWIRNGGERPFMIRYTDRDVTAIDSVIDFPPDTHEFAFGSMVRYNGEWLYAGIRTQWSTYPGDNRIRLMMAMTADPMNAPYQYTWWDLTPGDWNIMSSLVWIRNRLILFHGVQRWQIAIHETGPYGAPAMIRLPDGPSFPWSDVAWGNDGRLYALVSGGDSCWWSNCFEITEYESDDEGVTWSKGNRYWSVGELPGGILPFIGDAGYVRDELGHINRDALAVIGLVAPNENPASSTWRLHWWLDAGFSVPNSWGHDPGWSAPRIRRHLTLHTRNGK